MMINNITEELNEKLREACCMGDKETVYKCLAQGADINSKNKMNGWTSLHWASKRGHISLVEILLRSNADPSVLNDKQQTAYDVADIDDVRNVLSNCDLGSSNGNHQSNFKPVDVANTSSDNGSTKQHQNGTSFVPNYLRNPVFPYGTGSRNQQAENSINHNQQAFTAVRSTESKKTSAESISSNSNNNLDHENRSSTTKIAQQKVVVVEDDELVLKLRCPSQQETDFIEVELKMDELTYENLLGIGMREFGLDRVTKIRKLPDTIVRKDKDVRRLKQFQELEFI